MFTMITNCVFDWIVYDCKFELCTERLIKIKNQPFDPSSTSTTYKYIAKSVIKMSI